MIVASVRRGLTNVARPGGRDAHRHFWPYAIFVVTLASAAIMAVMLPPITAAVARVRRFAEAHPDQVTIRSGPGGTSMTVHGNVPGLMPDFSAMLTGVGIVMLIAALLLAAAVVRRLHDSNRSGWWALPVPLLLGAGMAGMASAIGEPDALSGGAFLLLFAANLFYIVTLVMLVFFLLLAGTPGSNRYGPPPTD